MKRILCALLAFMMLGITACGEESASGKAVWQDPNNVVVMWENASGQECNVLRSDKENGEYKLVGSSDCGSFRDDKVKYPNDYFYKIERADGGKKIVSAPVKAVVDRSMISSVSVIMYHNFVTDADIESGVEFEEYSIKPEDFEEDLIWLRDNGYVTITSDDLIKHLEGKKSLPEKAVIISIDDGSWGVYKNAWPLLKKYNMKADFNVIGRQIDDTWEMLDAGGTRVGEAAPFCTWEELAEMSRSGEINICSHTYGLHVYNAEKRIGMSMMENESAEDFANAVRDDYNLALRCIEGWLGKKPETVAYPYSKRSAEGDLVVLENTGYKILMAGDGARGTAGNYFVKGCDISMQYKLMSRPCRMEGTPIGVYLERIEEKDGSNGVNISGDYLRASDTDKIADEYQIFDDVVTGDWFAGSAYYSYLNELMKGVGNNRFAPKENISRSMAVTLLNRIAGNVSPESDMTFADASGKEWWFASAVWAAENNVLAAKDGRFNPNDSISREKLAQAMYNCGKYMKLDMSKRAELGNFKDSKQISEENAEAVSWTVACGIFKGTADGRFNPAGNVTRAEMSMILRNWLSEGEF